MTPACDHVKLLLGPFDDGELEPHEMEDVAVHVVSCAACKTALEDYRSIGLALRDSLREPSIEGFAESVLRRLDDFPEPLQIRVRRYRDSILEYLGGTASLVAAGAFAALITAWLVGPYAYRALHGSSNVTKVASRDRNETIQQPSGPAPGTANTGPDESQPPMIALSDDPTTTVIWLPTQQ
jgi:anti-sigma factor RsiW